MSTKGIITSTVQSIIQSDIIKKKSVLSKGINRIYNTLQPSSGVSSKKKGCPVVVSFNNFIVNKF